jgi:hypothetical protein
MIYLLLNGTMRKINHGRYSKPGEHILARKITPSPSKVKESLKVLHGHAPEFECADFYTFLDREPIR